MLIIALTKSNKYIVRFKTLGEWSSVSVGERFIMLEILCYCVKWTTNRLPYK